MLNVFPVHHIDQSTKYEKNRETIIKIHLNLNIYILYVYYEIPKIEYSGGIKNRFPQKRQGKN